jgi:ArsR family transcriptional regulator
LIRGEIEGITVCYCLNTELLRQVQGQFTSFFIEATASECVPDTGCC